LRFCAKARLVYKDDVALTDGRTCTVDEAAKRLGFTPQAIRNWLRAGKLAGFQVSEAGHWRVFVASIDAIVTRPVANIDIGGCEKLIAAWCRRAQLDGDAWWFWEGGFDELCANAPLNADAYRERLVRNGTIPSRESWLEAVANDNLEPVLLEPRKDLRRAQEEGRGVSYRNWLAMGGRPEAVCGWRVKGWQVPANDNEETE